MKEQKIAVIGMGMWGKNIVRNFYNLNALEMVCDLDDESLKSVQEQFPGVKVTKDFNDIINNLGNAPVLRLDLDSTKYTDKMTVNVIDLNWYKPYKKYGDVVLTGVFYAFYLWRLYNRISDIIRGVGSGAVDVININEVQGGKR